MQLVHYTHYTQKLQVAFRNPDYPQSSPAPPWNEINQGDWPLWELSECSWALMSWE